MTYTRNKSRHRRNVRSQTVDMMEQALFCCRSHVYIQRRAGTCLESLWGLWLHNAEVDKVQIKCKVSITSHFWIHSSVRCQAEETGIDIYFVLLNKSTYSDLKNNIQFCSVSFIIRFQWIFSQRKFWKISLMSGMNLLSLMQKHSPRSSLVITSC